MPAITLVSSYVKSNLSCSTIPLKPGKADREPPLRGHLTVKLATFFGEASCLFSEASSEVVQDRSSNRVQQARASQP